MRQFAAMVGISGPYLSQIERGLRAPSENVLSSIAERLQTTAESLYRDAGYEVFDYADTPDGLTRLAAVLERDQELTAAQRSALVEMYSAFRDANAVRRRRSGG